MRKLIKKAKELEPLMRKVAMCKINHSKYKELVTAISKGSEDRLTKAFNVADAQYAEFKEVINRLTYTTNILLLRAHETVITRIHYLELVTDLSVLSYQYSDMKCDKDFVMASVDDMWHEEELEKACMMPLKETQRTMAYLAALSCFAQDLTYCTRKGAVDYLGLREYACHARLTEMTYVLYDLRMTVGLNGSEVQFIVQGMADYLDHARDTLPVQFTELGLADAIVNVHANKMYKTAEAAKDFKALLNTLEKYGDSLFLQFGAETLRTSAECQDWRTVQPVYEKYAVKAKEAKGMSACFENTFRKILVKAAGSRQNIRLQAAVYVMETLSDFFSCDIDYAEAWEKMQGVIKQEKLDKKAVRVDAWVDRSFDVVSDWLHRYFKLQGEAGAEMPKDGKEYFRYLQLVMMHKAVRLLTDAETRDEYLRYERFLTEMSRPSIEVLFELNPEFEGIMQMLQSAEKYTVDSES